MDLHPLDKTIALQWQADGSATGYYPDDYWNMIGPFGGATAALMLNAVMRHPQRLGEPISVTVNYAGPVAQGPFTVQARAVRTNRSTQHWIIELQHPSEHGEPAVSTTATVVTAARRPTWGASDAPMPAVPPADAVPRAFRPVNVPWLQRYEFRPISGDIPAQWDGQGEHSLSQLWMRDDPPRPLDFCGLTALADVFFPRVWLRRAQRVPVGTVSMTVYFHADGRLLADSGNACVLGEARAQAYRHGFFDQSGLLWNAQGMLLASTHQVVYYKA